MKNAARESCPIVTENLGVRYAEKSREFQGCPSLAVTRGGKIYAAWYAGGFCEPHMDNYNLLVRSDNGGETWSEPILVIPSSRASCIHALDIQLWLDPCGALHVFWVQNNVRPVPDNMPPRLEGQPLVAVDGYLFDDFIHSEWEIVCADPDAEAPVFSAPHKVYDGFLRCKPLVLKDGRQLHFAYDQICGCYGYNLSQDGGKSFTRHYGAKKLATTFDEGMAYETENGKIRLLARSSVGELAQTYSEDAVHWTPAVRSGIVSADSRFFVSRMPSGRILLICNDHPSLRTNMTACLSEDDGKTWKYKLLIDGRLDVSYPDADFYGDTIYLTYDRERCGAKEILFLALTEEKIMRGGGVRPTIISKP